MTTTATLARPIEVVPHRVEPRWGSPEAQLRYILLPNRGLSAASTPEEGLFYSLDTLWKNWGSTPHGPLVEFDPAETSPTVSLVHPDAGPPETGRVRVTIVHSAFEKGPKLVELEPQYLSTFEARTRQLRLIVEQFHRQASSFLTVLPAGAPGARKGMTIQVLDSQSGSPISDVTVTIVVDAQNNTGDTGITDGNGEVLLQVPALALQADQLLVYPPKAGYWGAFRRASPIGPNPLQVGLTPVDPTWIDCLRYAYPSSIGDGAGVRIAIIDKGIEHPDIAVAGGRNTVIGELQTNDYGDNGTDGHGTHLAGIIASAGAVPSGVRGVAPAAEIYSYRVFGQGRQEGSDYSILVAALEALRDGCHLINLSVATQSDPLLRDLDEDIAERGGVCFAAAGNTNGGAVALPAAFPNTFAVSAMGRQGTLPPGVLEEANIGQPSGSDPNDFFAAFSSCGGAGIDLVAPGVGVISTVPGGHRPWSGTSQACAAATGAAARLLSGDPVLGRTADRSRSVDMKNLLTGRASPLGFGLLYEGSGRLQ